ncbi:MAG: hypothetical protein AVDCRST_MAG56-1869 [uncultured Cytophagales bacterium]|uniref:Uncharacterized protein n=1 Tax=uncultured Cytophagales bacterium TaxID=158755 RepID=A0A6J4IGV3_9SPHI|nr:MAG: hypothetical protein AVDCRST_MAG56-1869 [uncultured Cytophagales bacterium]
MRKSVKDCSDDFYPFDHLPAKPRAKSGQKPKGSREYALFRKNRRLF